MVLRIIAGGLIALVCAYVGVLVKRRYKEREKFFCDTHEYFAFFDKELTFSKTPLPDINAKFLKAGSGAFREYLARIVAENNGADLKSYVFLKKDEKEMLADAIGGLGRSAYVEQQSYVKRWEAEYKDKADKCSAENKKYGGMYFKLCVLLGVALLILIA